MKKLVYTRPDGGVSVVHPVEGARLAVAIKDAEGKDIARSATPVPVWKLARPWPKPGLTAEWAETEDEFASRAFAKATPADASNVAVVDEADVPKARADRDGWEIVNGRLNVNKEKAATVRATKGQ